MFHRSRGLAVGAVVVAATMALGACASERPAIESAASALEASVSEQRKPVARVRLAADSTLITYAHEGQITTWSLFPKPELSTDAKIRMPAVQPTDFDSTATVERAREIAAQCAGEYSLIIDTPLPDTSFTRASCKGEADRAFVGTRELARLEVEWTSANLATLWADYAALDPAQSVKRLQLANGQLTADMLPAGAPNEDCGLVFDRNLSAPAESRVQCQPSSFVPNLPLSLTEATPERIAPMIQAAMQRAGIRPGPDVHISITGSSLGPSVTVVGQGKQSTLPAEQ